MIQTHPDGELRVSFSWDLVWQGLAGGALLGLLLVVVILGSALLGPTVEGFLK